MSPDKRKKESRVQPPFAVHTDEFPAGKQPWKYLVYGPRELGQEVKAKAKGKISLRGLILGLLRRWVTGDIQHPPDQPI